MDESNSDSNGDYFIRLDKTMLSFVNNRGYSASCNYIDICRIVIYYLRR